MRRPVGEKQAPEVRGGGSRSYCCTEEAARRPIGPPAAAPIKTLAASEVGLTQPPRASGGAEEQGVKPAQGPASRRARTPRHRRISSRARTRCAPPARARRRGINASHTAASAAARAAEGERGASAKAAARGCGWRGCRSWCMAVCTASTSEARSGAPAFSHVMSSRGRASDTNRGPAPVGGTEGPSVREATSALSAPEAVGPPGWLRTSPRHTPASPAVNASPSGMNASPFAVDASPLAVDPSPLAVDGSQRTSDGGS
eukprot:scaffold1551_cov77-Isochrysis_galbana.AAC.2